MRESFATFFLFLFFPFDDISLCRQFVKPCQSICLFFPEAGETINYKLFLLDTNVTSHYVGDKKKEEHRVKEG